MTPEQHYQHGVDLLTAAEAQTDPVVGQKLAVTALGNFIAAMSAAEIRSRALLSKAAEVGDRVAVTLPGAGRNVRPRRLVGVVTQVGADGIVTAEFDQGDLPPMEISAPSEAFIVVQVAGRTAPAVPQTRT